MCVNFKAALLQSGAHPHLIKLSSFQAHCGNIFYDNTTPYVSHSLALSIPLCKSKSGPIQPRLSSFLICLTHPLPISPNLPLPPQRKFHMTPATPNSYPKNARRRLSEQKGSKCATLRTSRFPIPAKPQNFATLCRPSLIAADWHLRNPDKNHGLLSLKVLFRLFKMGWFILTDIRRYFNPYDYVALAYYSNDKPDEQRYPFVVVSQNKSIPTPSQRVRLRSQAGLATYPGEVFFEYTPMGYLNDEREGKGGPPLRAPTPVPAETTSTSTSAVVQAEAEAVVVSRTTQAERRKVNSTTDRQPRETETIANLKGMRTSRSIYFVFRNKYTRFTFTFVY